jgi:formylglycine-generating enzyme required for sulfatase activity
LLNGQSPRASSNSNQPRSASGQRGPATRRPVLVAPGEEAGQEYTDNDLKMALRWCPSGEFAMGHRKPRETVSMGGFWIAQTEVTQGQWKLLMGTTPWAGRPSVRNGANYPATYITVDDMTVFCQRLTTVERKAGRLPEHWSYQMPTDEQWEYACRAGTTTAYYFGDDTAPMIEYAWFKDNATSAGEDYAHEVAQKTPNGWGLLDMYGNVREACRAAPNAAASTYGGAETGWVGRGGDYLSVASVCNSSFGVMFRPSVNSFGVGFRPVLGPARKESD